jgi:hypothetical protein
MLTTQITIISCQNQDIRIKPVLPPYSVVTIYIHSHVYLIQYNFITCIPCDHHYSQGTQMGDHELYNFVESVSLIQCNSLDIHPTYRADQ